MNLPQNVSKRASNRASKSAVLYAVILSLLLLVPTLSIRFVDHDARKAWENRNLAKMPEKSQFLNNPKAAFGNFNDWLNDHIGGSFQAIKFRRKFYFDVFNVTGDTYIVGENDGALFLTAPFRQKDRNTPFQWWQNICGKLQVEGFQKNYLQKVWGSHKMISSRGARVIYTSIPSKPVLIPHKFPKSAPAKFKPACEAVTPENNHIQAMRIMSPETEFFYPLEVFQKKVEDPYFYPNSAYHWKGESAWVFIEEFAKKYNFDLPKSWPQGPCTEQELDWDIGKLIGVGQTTRGCDRERSMLEIEIDSGFMYPLSETAQAKNPKKKAIKVVKMTNPHAPNNKSAIIFSNSFGPEVREQYASLFKTTYHLRLGIINTPDMKLLLRETDILDVDLAIIAIADFHYPNFLTPLMAGASK